MTDGESPESAVRNAREAIEGWLDAAREMKRPIPQPVYRRVAV